MQTKTLEKILKVLKQEIRQWKVPAVGAIADQAPDHLVDRPFRTLISTVLSLRTKDEVTEPASLRLLKKGPTPQKLLKLSIQEIERLIYPVGFYPTKAKQLKRICQILIDQYDGRVPRGLNQLLELPGVGRKTTNLVVTVGYGDYGICVDTHVHRISNRWGYVKTKTPEETEFALREKLPRNHWKTYNDILVTFGQNLCVPVSPWCSRCKIKSYCKRVGVERSR